MCREAQYDEVQRWAAEPRPQSPVYITDYITPVDTGAHPHQPCILGTKYNMKGNVFTFTIVEACIEKYVVKHKSAKLYMMYAVGKLRGSSQYKPFNIKYKQQSES